MTTIAQATNPVLLDVLKVFCNLAPSIGLDLMSRGEDFMISPSNLVDIEVCPRTETQSINACCCPSSRLSSFQYFISESKVARRQLSPQKFQKPIVSWRKFRGNPCTKHCLSCGAMSPQSARMTGQFPSNWHFMLNNLVRGSEAPKPSLFGAPDLGRCRCPGKMSG